MGALPIGSIAWACQAVNGAVKAFPLFGGLVGGLRMATRRWLWGIPNFFCGDLG
ncbi:hypothetical protein SAMN02787118_10521 [Streptomyces mirabilis]|jgi:hypothetical protein|uniref:Uncharacterized protein n=1 Tax=Streptomyces mirabilis TaxID=68239 RepID=A0A1I2H950_9ACTN|nr:hypothetical protein SAMN02787118_10521 [Streptomyces mirabilis]